MLLIVDDVLKDENEHIDVQYDVVVEDHDVHVDYYYYVDDDPSYRIF